MSAHFAPSPAQREAQDMATPETLQAAQKAAAQLAAKLREDDSAYEVCTAAFRDTSEFTHGMAALAVYLIRNLAVHEEVEPDQLAGLMATEMAQRLENLRAEA